MPTATSSLGCLSTRCRLHIRQVPSAAARASANSVSRHPQREPRSVAHRAAERETRSSKASELGVAAGVKASFEDRHNEISDSYVWHRASAAQWEEARQGQPAAGLPSGFVSCMRSLLSPARPRASDRFGDLCCAQDYVAYPAEREGASGCLRADRGLRGTRRVRSLGRQCNIFPAGLTSRPSRCGPTMSGSTGMPCTLRSARDSSDACSIALGRRVAKPGQCRTGPAVRVARRAEIMLR